MLDTLWHYFRPLSDWHLQQNELIYVYPKKMSVSNAIMRNRKTFTMITVTLENADLQMQVPFYDEEIFCCDLKMILSLQFHLHMNTIIIKIFHVNTKKTIVPEDRFKISITDIQNNFSRISIQITDSWGDDSYLGAFNSNMYYSCTDQIMSDWNYFNSLLLFLAKEQSEISQDKLLEKLGLIRKISCSPPLVYALYRLLSGLRIVLPHRVAINEGILISLSLLLPNEDTPKIHKFCEFWMYIESQASPEHMHIEIYEQNYISKRSRDNAKDVDVQRLIYVFPESENPIITWKDCPSAHEPFNYRTLPSLCISQDRIIQRFPLKHPIELYQQFLNKEITYGLVRAEVDGLSSPTVFLGRTNGRYGYFDFYSPESGKCSSLSPHDAIFSKSSSFDSTKKYSKMFIILDISNDMSLGSQEYQNGRDDNEPNIVLCHIDMGLYLIELLIDSITGFGCKNLVGIILISNDHKFTNGFYELQKPTLEYASSLRKLKMFIEENRPQKDLFRRQAEGIILNILFYLMNNYPPNEEVYIFTTNCNKKYYGSRMDNLRVKLKYNNFIINMILLSDKRSESLLNFSESLQGVYIDMKVITTNRPYQSSPHIPSTFKNIHSHYLIEYFSLLQDKRCIKNIGPIYGSYNKISSNFKQSLVSIENILTRNQAEKDHCTNMNKSSHLPNVIHILRQISNYSKNPNPFCRLFSVSDQIQHLISIIQGPDNTPYTKSVLFLEIRFGKYFPQSPPRFRFLSSYFHPNITASGEVCHPILFEDYHPDVSLRQFLDAFYQMLYTPVITHAVRYKVLEISLFYKKLYNLLVKSFIKVFCFDTPMSASLCALNMDESCKNTHPEPYLCPLTNELFDLPVITPEGNTYERHAILQYLKFSQTDPITNTPLSESDLIPNNPVMSAVYKYRKKCCVKSYWWD